MHVAECECFWSYTLGMYLPESNKTTQQNTERKRMKRNGKWWQQKSEANTSTQRILWIWKSLYWKLFGAVDCNHMRHTHSHLLYIYIRHRLWKNSVSFRIKICSTGNKRRCCRLHVSISTHICISGKRLYERVFRRQVYIAKCSVSAIRSYSTVVSTARKSYIFLFISFISLFWHMVVCSNIYTTNALIFSSFDLFFSLWENLCDTRLCFCIPFHSLCHSRATFIVIQK